MVQDRFILVEDSDTAKLCHSGWHDLIERFSDDDYIVVYYRNVGYSSAETIRQWLSLKPQYLGNSSRDVDESSNTYIEKLNIEYDQIIEDAKTLGLKLFNSYDIKRPLSIYGIKYNNIYIGRYIASHILRFYPEQISIFQPDPNLVCTSLIHLCTHILLIEKLTKIANISYAFFSETVYFAGAIVEQLVIAGAKMPYLFYPTQVTLSQSNCNTSYIGKSLVYQSIQHVYEKIITKKHTNIYRRILQFGKKELMNRLNDVQHINSGASQQGLENAAILFSEKDRLSYYVQDVQQLVSSKAPLIIFYLHCFADGPHYEGFSGFPSSYQFFKYIAHEIANSTASKQYRVVLKPHPNLFLGLESPFANDTQKMNYDVRLTLQLIDELRQVLPTLLILNPSVSNFTLIGLTQSVHVTSHGSVGLEARYKGMPLICANTAPYQGIGLGELCIYSDKECDIQNFLLNISSKNLFEEASDSVSEKAAIYTGIISFMERFQYLDMASNFLGIGRNELSKKLLKNPLLIEENLDEVSLRLLKKLASKLINFYELSGNQD